MAFIVKYFHKDIIKLNLANYLMLLTNSVREEFDFRPAFFQTF